MSDDTPSPLNNVITIDDERIKSHLERVVRGTVEETLNALLDAEADRLSDSTVVMCIRGAAVEGQADPASDISSMPRPVGLVGRHLCSIV
jgi:hypothetical protein